MKYKWLKTIIHQDNAMSHLLQLMICFLRHWLSQTLASVIGTILIALLIGIQYTGFWFIVSCIFYVLLLIGIALAQNYEKDSLTEARERIKQLQTDASNQHEQTEKTIRDYQLEIQHLINVNSSLTTINSTAAKEIYRIARKIKHETWPENIKHIRETYGFQKIGFAVCKEIYDLIHETLGTQGQWITLYQRFEENGKNYCKMIAYYNFGCHEPQSYQVVYDMPKKRKNKGKKELHTKLFADNFVGVKILTTADEVKQNFVYHSASKVREEAVQQYIGIAEKVCNRETTFLLQIDIEKADAFGKNQTEMEVFVEKYIRPYALLLGMHYEIDRYIEVATNYVEKIEGGRNDGKEEQHPNSTTNTP